MCVICSDTHLIGRAMSHLTAFWLVIKVISDYSMQHTFPVRAQSCVEHLGSRELQCRELEAVLINTSDSEARRGEAGHCSKGTDALLTVDVKKSRGKKRNRVSVLRVIRLKLQENYPKKQSCDISEWKRCQTLSIILSSLFSCSFIISRPLAATCAHTLGGI